MSFWRRRPAVNKPAILMAILAFWVSNGVLDAAPPPANGPDAAFASPAGISPTTGQPSPFMGFLDQIGIGQSLEAANIRMFGHIEGSYTKNFYSPVQDVNLGRVFDSRDDRPII